MMIMMKRYKRKRVKINFTVDVKALERLRRETPRLFHQCALKTGEAVEAAAVLLISRGGEMRAEATGHMKGRIGSTVVKRGGNVRAVVYAATPYAEYVHEGTGIYGPLKRPIRPVRGKALEFEIGGQKLVRRSVKGMRPRPFLTRAVRKVIPRKLNRIWERAAGVRIVK